jgi:hypothetical protein
MLNMITIIYLRGYGVDLSVGSKVTFVWLSVLLGTRQSVFDALTMDLCSLIRLVSINAGALIARSVGHMWTPLYIALTRLFLCVHIVAGLQYRRTASLTVRLIDQS